MAGLRKNAADLTRQEWRGFVRAIDATHGAQAERPAYREFVQIHVRGMSSPAMHEWGVHTMPGMVGRNFLAWHRLYLLRFEERLQRVDENVTLPYWDWVAHPTIPAALRSRHLLERLSVSREWNARLMPGQQDVEAANARENFAAFQSALEFVHNDVHRAVGGLMATIQSPADPLFWLHHANIDRLWAQWQDEQRHAGNRRARPANATEQLQPPPLFDRAVSRTLDISRLRYSYA